MSGSHRVQDGKVVLVHYRLTLDGVDGVVDSTEGDEAMAYLHGADNIVPGLEEHMNGKAMGARFDAIVQPTEGYGVRDDTAVRVIPREAFPEDAERPVVSDRASVFGRS